MSERAIYIGEADAETEGALIRCCLELADIAPHRVLSMAGLFTELHDGAAPGGTPGPLALLSTGFPQLTPASLTRLLERQVQVVLLGPPLPLPADLGRAISQVEAGLSPSALKERLRAILARLPDGKSIVQELQASTSDDALVCSAIGEPTGGAILTGIGGRSGPGATSALLNLALALPPNSAAPGAAEGLLLLDADLQGGSVGTALGLLPQRSLYGVAYRWHHQASLRPTQTDKVLSKLSWGSMLESEAQVIAPGVRVLSGGVGAERYATPAFFSELLAAARPAAALTIVDAGSTGGTGLTPVQQYLLSGSDLILLFLRPDLSALEQARSLLTGIKGVIGHQATGERVHIILSPYERRAHDAEAVALALEHPVTAWIPSAPLQASLALSRQQPVVRGDPHSDLAASYQELAAYINGTPRARPGWLSRLFARLRQRRIADSPGRSAPEESSTLWTVKLADTAPTEQKEVG